jgi:polyferredoxin
MKRITNYRMIVQSAALAITVFALVAANGALKIPLLAIMFLGGAFYCGWICPFGFLQDTGSRIGKMIGIRKRKVPESIHGAWIYSRYFLALLVAMAASDLLFTILGYDPRGTALGILSGSFPAYGALGVMVVFIVISMVYERPYCRYFCITGASYGAGSLFRIFTVRRNAHICVKCGKCDKACPMQIQVTKVEDLRSPQCVNCLECVGACPVKGALSFGPVSLGKFPKTQSVGTPNAQPSGKRKSA